MTVRISLGYQPVEKKVKAEAQLSFPRESTVELQRSNDFFNGLLCDDRRFVASIARRGGALAHREASINARYLLSVQTSRLRFRPCFCWSAALKEFM